MWLHRTLCTQAGPETWQSQSLGVGLGQRSKDRPRPETPKRLLRNRQNNSRSDTAGYITACMQLKINDDIYSMCRNELWSFYKLATTAMVEQFWHWKGNERAELITIFVLYVEQNQLEQIAFFDASHGPRLNSLSMLDKAYAKKPYLG